MNPQPYDGLAAAAAPASPAPAAAATPATEESVPLKDRFFGAIPGAAAMVGTRLVETTTSSFAESWKAIFVALVVFLLFSYAFRINWNRILDGIADYVVVFSQNLLRSFRETPKQVREKRRAADNNNNRNNTKAAAGTTTTTAASSSSSRTSSRTAEDLLRPVTTARTVDKDDDGVVDLTSSSSGFRVAATPPEGWVNPRYLAPESFQSPSPSSPPAPPAKGHQFCLVGQLPSAQPGVAPQRGCVLVKSPDECLSGQLFATKLECLRPPSASTGAADAK